MSMSGSKVGTLIASIPAKIFKTQIIMHFSRHFVSELTSSLKLIIGLQIHPRFA